MDLGGLYSEDMPWRTYTPDGRTLEVERQDDGVWLAACESGTATATTPAEAMREALGSEPTIGAAPRALDAWIEQRADQYERELDG
jgi:hypothetical protein